MFNGLHRVRDVVDESPFVKSLSAKAREPIVAHPFASVAIAFAAGACLAVPVLRRAVGRSMGAMLGDVLAQVARDRLLHVLRVAPLSPGVS
jgi:hypothetical protein